MIRIEQVKTMEMTTLEGKYFFVSWYRIADQDDSTIAYAPDRATAQQIADLFNKGEKND